MDLAKYKKITRTNIEQKPSVQERKELKLKESVLLFFSYDIVNSSIYKTVNYYGWSVVIEYILSELRNRVKAKINLAEVWRVFGDEIIFIVKIYDVDSIYEYIEELYEILIEICTSIETGNFFDKLEGFSEVVIELMKVQDVISLKACAWIATVTDRNDIKENNSMQYVANIFEIIEESPNNKFYEFIGADIDTGFRLTKETREKRLVLSFELACILAKQEDFVKRLNIITYRKLKGVWESTSYPIIWYYNSKKNNNRTFKESIPFDAIEQDEIYVEYFGNKKFAKYMYEDVRSALQKIAFDKKLQHKIKHIEEVIVNSTKENRRFINNTMLELHCVAVCYNEKNQILIVKRSNRALLSDKWEFGCTKANTENQLVETIVEEYKKDFNLEVEVICDETREDIQPIPIVLYEIKKENELHKGIIVLAKMISSEIKLNTKKHSEYRMLEEKDIELLNEEECVSDMKETLKLAFKKIKELK